jgi:hypothetical protein
MQGLPLHVASLLDIAGAKMAVSILITIKALSFFKMCRH